MTSGSLHTTDGLSGRGGSKPKNPCPHFERHPHYEAFWRRYGQVRASYTYRLTRAVYRSSGPYYHSQNGLYSAAYYWRMYLEDQYKDLWNSFANSGGVIEGTYYSPYKSGYNAFVGVNWTRFMNDLDPIVNPFNPM